MKTTPQLIKELREMPMGNLYLEKGMLQKELCQRFGMDFYTVKTADFEQKCDEILIVERVREVDYREKVKADLAVKEAEIADKKLRDKIESKIKPGDLFVCSWGATMRRNGFYQVVSVRGCKVWLTHPLAQVESDGYNSGKEWIHARNTDETVQAYAKIIRGKLKLCTGPEFKAKDNYWYYLKPTEIGKKESFYGD